MLHEQEAVKLIDFKLSQFCSDNRRNIHCENKFPKSIYIFHQNIVISIQDEMPCHLNRRFIPLQQKICQKNPIIHMQSIDAAGIDSSCKGKSELPVKAQY